MEGLRSIQEADLEGVVLKRNIPQSVISYLDNVRLNDIQRITREIGKILSAPELQVRVDVVEGDACRKFHRDNVKARLICTYKCLGTVYGFAKAGEQPTAYESAGLGEPILLKGKLWPRAKNTDADEVLLHRSPRIKGTGLARLVVVIANVSAPYVAV